MLEQILTNQYVQYAIAVILAVLIGGLLKITIEWRKLVPVIVAICALIFKEEPKSIEKWEKNLDVSSILEREAPKIAEKAKKKWGTVANAVTWTYQKIAKPLIGSGIIGLIRKL